MRIGGYEFKRAKPAPEPERKPLTDEEKKKLSDALFGESFAEMRAKHAKFEAEQAKKNGTASSMRLT